ncbi:MAG: alpha/beta hydrolase [Anaerolineae bacterium]|nr:alpha/beta hydrolase [Anaerolineae bacterium]
MIPSHWTEKYLTINGVSYHYWRTGEGSKPPLVLAHGFSDNGLCWLQTALDLEADYDIIMPDARGHGLSARIQPGEGVDMGADLAGIIQALGLQHPIVGGHSMGARVAFELGVRYPEIPRALLLEDPPWFEHEESVELSQLSEHPMAPWVETVTRLTLDELIADTRIEHPTWPEWVIDTWCPAKKQMDPNILSILSIDESDWEENVPQLTCPTLIVTADLEKGGLLAPAIAKRVQELNPKISILHIPGTGHHIRFEDYESYMKNVHAFFLEIE